MARDRGLESIGKRPEIPLTPEIADDLRPLDAELLPTYGNGGRLIAKVKKPDRLGTILETPCPDLNGSVHGNPARRFPQRILIHIEHLIIAQQALGEIIQLGHITSD